MNKIPIVIALFVFFQAPLHAEDYSTPTGTGTSRSEPEISTPAVGSQYNLDGMQTRGGQYKSSYSTSSVDDRNVAKEQASSGLQESQRSQPVQIPGSASGSNGIGVIIVIDE